MKHIIVTLPPIPKADREVLHGALANQSPAAADLAHETFSRADLPRVPVQWDLADEAMLGSLRFLHGLPLRVVMQVGPGALQAIDGGTDLAMRLDSYGGVVSDALLDASGGKGVPIDAGALVGDVVRAQLPLVGVGIAGGLCAEAITPTIGKLLRAGASIDAEGRLRDDADGGGNMNLDKMTAYLRAAVAEAAAQ